MVGKLPPDLLEKYVFRRIGKVDNAVIVGPFFGEDSAVIDLGDGKVLVAHVDPITGAVEFLGWLAVHIACNDVVVTGAKPRWLLSVLYLPEDSDESLIDKITSQIDSAAKEVGAMVVGGHSEFTPGLNRPFISMTALGITSKDKFVRTGGAKAGDVVLMTKTVAIEGTAIISSDFGDVLLKKGVSKDVIERGKEFIKSISVAKEALALADAGLATSMHDPTEGGLIGGLTEIAYASRKTIEIWEERVPVAPETKVMCEALNVDMLKLISSGVLVATVPKEKVSEAVRLLKSIGIQVTIIGKVLDFNGDLVTIHRKDGRVEHMNTIHVTDELVKLWEEYKV
ncbi:MAG: hydrogenase assembly protein HupF [Desulfurococcales archaeon ex4484_42]|nr:MAG: hydrogenase assembly protein HupF [Desulfurococcales archaeon ex4484_42]